MSGENTKVKQCQCEFECETLHNSVGCRGCSGRHLIGKGQQFVRRIGLHSVRLLVSLLCSYCVIAAGLDEVFPCLLTEHVNMFVPEREERLFARLLNQLGGGVAASQSLVGCV